MTNQARTRGLSVARSGCGGGARPADLGLRHDPPPGKDAAHSKINSLAVLPLKNLSGDPTQEYLADGMTEELIGRLAGIHDLRVVSRTSVMRFKDTQLSVPGVLPEPLMSMRLSKGRSYGRAVAFVSTPN